MGHQTYPTPKDHRLDISNNWRSRLLTKDALLVHDGETLLTLWNISKFWAFESANCPEKFRPIEKRIRAEIVKRLDQGATKAILKMPRERTPKKPKKDDGYQALAEFIVKGK